jgi:hypothetical protein
LVSTDPVTIQQFSLALQELSISPDICREAGGAVRLSIAQLRGRESLAPSFSYDA